MCFIIIYSIENVKLINENLRVGEVRIRMTTAEIFLGNASNQARFRSTECLNKDFVSVRSSDTRHAIEDKLKVLSSEKILDFLEIEKRRDQMNVLVSRINDFNCEFASLRLSFNISEYRLAKLA